MNQRNRPDTSNYADALRSAMREDPTSYWSARCATLKRFRLRSRRLKPAIWCCPPFTTNTIQIISGFWICTRPTSRRQVRLQLAETLKGAISQRLLPFG